jgi:superfamily II DNA or RNA helicase
MFRKAPKQWYLQYILKVPTVQDLSYAKGGSVLHTCLEEYYNGKVDREGAKKLLNTLWVKEGLDNACWLQDKPNFILSQKKKSEYDLMLLNGIDLQLPITTTEMKLFWADVVGYIDVVCSKEGMLADWKSSTRRPENEEEYTNQLKFYAYLWWRKTNELPRILKVYYLKYTGSKGTLEYVPTIDDVKEMEHIHWETNKAMEAMATAGKVPECNGCANNPFCSYKNHCSQQVEGELNYTIHNFGHKIQIDGMINPVISNQLDKKFSYELKNAFWMKKNNPHANTTIKFWNPGARTLPIGFLAGVQKTLNDYGEWKGVPVNIKIKDERVFNDERAEMPERFINGRTLRPYQQTAVEKFLANTTGVGILELATGAGKTEIAIELIRRLCSPTLFVVDKVELLNQTKKRIEESLGIKVGIIGQGKQETETVTVATIQTLLKHIHALAPWLATINFAVFDECHKVAAKSYVRLSQYLMNTKYRLGISGTAFRDDGNDMQITSVVGEKIYIVNSDFLITNGWLVNPKIVFMKNYMSEAEKNMIAINASDGSINEEKQYAKYYTEGIANNLSRNLKVSELVARHRGEKILILTKLVDHGKSLEASIPGSKHLYGSTKKSERDRIFKDFSEGKLNILISTISIFAEGIDLPALSIVINASANKGDIKTIQILGRVLRKMEGKEAAYYDFFDDVEFFRSASWARIKALRGEGHTVEYEKS